MTATPTTAYVNASVQFFANANFGGIVDHQWSIADAPNSSIVNTTFTTPGTHTVTLTMSNESGQSATCNTSVTINASYPRCEPQYNALVCQELPGPWMPRPGWPQGYEFEVTDDWNGFGGVLPKGKYYSIMAFNQWSWVTYPTGTTLPNHFFLAFEVQNAFNFVVLRYGRDAWCDGDGSIDNAGGYRDPWAENTFNLPGSPPGFCDCAPRLLTLKSYSEFTPG